MVGVTVVVSLVGISVLLSMLGIVEVVGEAVVSLVGSIKVVIEAMVTYYRYLLYTQLVYNNSIPSEGIQHVKLDNWLQYQQIY